MIFHALDLIVYIVLAILLFIALPQEYKYEMGIVTGTLIMLVYTALYIYLFVFIDYNWLDIINNIIAYFNQITIVW